MMHTVAERRSNQVEDLGWTGEFVYQVGSDRGELWKTSHIDIRYTRVRSGLQQEFVIPNFFIHFWYSDVTVKRNETTQSSHLDLSDLTQTTDGGAGGSGSGGAREDRTVSNLFSSCALWIATVCAEPRSIPESDHSVVPLR